MQYYQQKVNPQIATGKWTEEEDKLLVEAVKVYGERNWQQVTVLYSLTL
jgi:hypothetical protein